MLFTLQQLRFLEDQSAQYGVSTLEYGTETKRLYERFILTQSTGLAIIPFAVFSGIIIFIGLTRIAASVIAAGLIVIIVVLFNFMNYYEEEARELLGDSQSLTKLIIENAKQYNSTKDQLEEIFPEYYSSRLYTNRT